MRKIELYQVGQTTITEDFTPYAAGIYWRKMSLSDEDRALSPIETIFSATWDSTLSNEPVSITGVTFDEIQLSEVNTIAELYLQDGSFYFDEANQDLYVAIFDYRNFIINDVVQLGQTLGFIDQAQLVDINGINYPLETMVGSVYYDPRLNDVSISEKISDQKNGLFVFGDLEASIKNNDGEYDFIADSITGNQAVLLVANISDSPEEEIETGFPYKLAATAEDFKISRKGIVQTVDYSDPDNPNIKAIDIRANWTQTIGENLLTVSEFPNLPDKYIDKRKPIAIGTIQGVKGIPLRDNATAASFDYFICDTTHGAIQSVSQVYFKGQLGTGDVDRFLTGGEYSVNLSTGIITISNCVKGDVHVYGVFTTMEETVEIILYLLNLYENIAYIDSNFNKEEIEEVRSQDYTTHVYITERGNTLIKVIEKLCDDIKIDFFQQGEVLTMRESNKRRASVEEIENFQIIDNPPSWDNNRTDTIKTISVDYNPDYRTKLSETYYDNSLLQEAIDNNRNAVDEVFSVNLNSVTDIETIYDLFYNRFVEVPRTVTLRRTIPFTARVADFVTFPVVRTINGIEKIIFNNGIYKITDYNEIENTIEAVWFADSSDLDYFDGGNSTTDYSFYESGDSTTDYDYLDGGGS
jgi:hypothetical protein